MKTIYANTPPGFNPPFINLSEDDDGNVVVMIRGELEDGVQPHVTFTLSFDEIMEMNDAIFTNFFAISDEVEPAA